MRLYAITPEWLSEEELFKAVERAIEGGITALQYRAKEKTAAKMLKEASVLKNMCREVGIPFIVNDRLDVALLCGADGVHVGQDDLPAQKILSHACSKDLIVGLSTHSEREVAEANATSELSYIGFGAVFFTKSKREHKLVGLKALKEAVKLSRHPVIAIGGITAENAPDVLKTGVYGIAAIRAVFEGDPKKNAETLREIIEEFAVGGD